MSKLQQQQNAARDCAWDEDGIRIIDDDKRPKKVVVHSWNTARAHVMVKLLQDYGYNVTYEPFSAPTPKNKDKS